ncbi:MucR family transcriptional regulator [Magnetospirillum sp. XM-1]|uniref:MucR family transcriptional regulator n=1 Tax=Magnetospirillum sp. XM-1 TaxID=1663591 RepID=UPI0009E72362|nr:MucR family transcriptional regulator [Magnetospirillum sp. XM-1]
MADDIKALTTKIVSAYLGSSTLAATEIPSLIKSVYSSLKATITPVAAPTVSQKPAVSIKRSVTEESVICLECGSHQKLMKRHLNRGHGLSIEGYRMKWDLPADYPMVAPNYAAHRSRMAVKFGLGISRHKPKSETIPDASSDTGVAHEAAPAHVYPTSRWAKPSS